MRYSEALEFLRGLQRAGMRPGLDRVLRLAAAAGNPERELRFIHVAGTNGKGSTCAFLESLYRARGHRVGLYTSPHLGTFRERIQVDRVPIPEAEAARLIASLAAKAEGAGTPDGPSFFEFTTVLALEWFRVSGCEVVIWETGMGGRRDATNIVTPLASVITNIGWDHMPWLGNTLAAIAGEKAGIFKPGVPALTAVEEPSALEVLRETARSLGVPLRCVLPKGPEVAALLGAGLDSGMTGEHQVLNAALALATAEELGAVPAGDRANALRALANTQWPGRFQVLPMGSRELVLDAAHNQPAFRALASALDERFPGDRHAVVLGLFPDKDPDAAADLLLAGATRVVVVPIGPGAGREHEAEALAVRWGGRGIRCERAVSVREALARLSGEGRIVVTGSFQVVGEALDVVSGRSEAESERWLNEWRPPPVP